VPMRKHQSERHHSIVPISCDTLATKSACLAKRGLLLLEQLAARSNRRSGLGWTPLHIAAIGDHKREAEMLITHGSDVNARDKFGHTPLFFAKSAYITQVLVSGGADVNARRDDGATPLYKAARIGSRQVARILIDAGADVNAAQDGATALHVSARRGHWAVADLLIEHGANANAVDELGRTPLELAEVGGHEEVAKLIRRFGGR